MQRILQLKTEYYEKTYSPYPAARNGCGERNSGPHVSGRRPRRGRAGTGRGVCDGGTAQGRRAGGRHGDRRRRTFRAEGPDGRIHPLDPVSGFRSRPAAGARRCGQRSGRHRAEKLLDADRGRGGQGAADPPRGRPLCRRCGQRPGGDRQGWHRTAGARSGRMGGRREDLDQRQERFEGVRQRPRAAHGTGAAADLPAFAARRRHPENRGRAHDRRGLRCGFVGRHHPDNAPQTPRKRHGGVAVGRFAAGPLGAVGQSPCARQLPFGTARPLRAGVVQPRNRRIRIGRKHPLHVGEQQSRSPLRKIRTRPEFRRELRFGVRDQFPPERRRGVRILAQPRKRSQRLLHGLHGRRGGDPHRQPL